METRNVSSAKRKSPLKSKGYTEVSSLHSSHECPHCGASDVKIKTREISMAAWNALLAWQDVDSETIGKPICQQCYDELREILIDRADEIHSAGIAGSHKIAS